VFLPFRIFHFFSSRVLLSIRAAYGGTFSGVLAIPRSLRRCETVPGFNTQYPRAITVRPLRVSVRGFLRVLLSVRRSLSAAGLGGLRTWLIRPHVFPGCNRARSGRMGGGRSPAGLVLCVVPAARNLLRLSTGLPFTRVIHPNLLVCQPPAFDQISRPPTPDYRL